MKKRRSKAEQLCSPTLCAQGRLASTPVFLRQLSSRAEPSKDASRPHNGDTKFLAALRACSAQPGLNIADNVDTYFPTSRHDAAAAGEARCFLQQQTILRYPARACRQA